MSKFANIAFPLASDQTPHIALFELAEMLAELSGKFGSKVCCKHWNIFTPLTK